MPRRINLIQVNVEPVLLTFVLINLFYFLHLLAHYFIFIERKATIHENIDENFVQWRNLLARYFVIYFSILFISLRLFYFYQKEEFLFCVKALRPNKWKVKPSLQRYIHAILGFSDQFEFETRKKKWRGRMKIFPAI